MAAPDVIDKGGTRGDGMRWPDGEIAVGDPPATDLPSTNSLMYSGRNMGPISTKA